MKRTTVQRAVLARGPVICPDCREKHCDFCGLVGEYNLVFAGDTPARICNDCVHRLKPGGQPQCFCVVKVDVGYMATLGKGQVFAPGDLRRTLNEDCWQMLAGEGEEDAEEG